MARGGTKAQVSCVIWEMSAERDCLRRNKRDITGCCVSFGLGLATEREAQRFPILVMSPFSLRRRNYAEVHAVLKVDLEDVDSPFPQEPAEVQKVSRNPEAHKLLNV